MRCTHWQPSLGGICILCSVSLWASLSVSFPLSFCVCVYVSLHHFLCLPPRVLFLFQALFSPGANQETGISFNRHIFRAVGLGDPSSL